MGVYKIMKYYMISLKDEYFNRMIKSEKSYEFRRVFAKSLDSPFLCAIYISSPIQAVRGIVEFDRPQRGTVEELIELALRENYPFIDSVRDYFRGKNFGYALHVRGIKVFRDPIDLKRLRTITPNFTPPQSFYCLENEQFLKLREFIDNHEP